MKVTTTKKELGRGEVEESEMVACMGEAGGGGGGGSRDEKSENGKMVVVGVKMDAQSRELLTWALVKVAQPGDRVVALHVLLNSSHSDGKSSSSATVSLVKACDSVLAVYEGFCNLKQIDLKLKICRGSSIRKVLVREAVGVSAAKVILGIAKSSRGIGSSSTSIAKYCAKKLLPKCSVLAVNNGKIVFQREAPPPPAGRCADIKGSSKSKNCRQPSKIQQPSSKNSMLLNGSNDNSLCLLPTKKYGPKKLQLTDTPGVSPKKNCWICSPVKDPARVGNGAFSTQFGEDGSTALVPIQNAEHARAPISILIRDLPEAKPGWPLLRKAVLHKKTTSEKSDMSVVQWAMHLPSRYPASLAGVHPEQKLAIPEMKAIGSLDSESGAIIPVGTDAPHLSGANGNENSSKVPKELESLPEKYASTCRLFNYQELANATSNFSAENLIGKGGSSRVYKGCLPDGRELAVKILKQSEEVLREFVLEIEIITTLHHNNVISLFGFCFDNNNLLLVYDFLSRGSLEENLHGVKKNKNGLGWAERYKVAVGVAEALEYLHNGGGSQPVIHRDVKSSNILLSDDFEPQLADFGLATWASSSSSLMTCSDVAGTFGYLAPEYFMYGKVSEKIDVYAFGVVLLELLSGRRPIENEYPKDQQSLVMWAKPILQSGKAAQLLDPSLGSQHDKDQLERMMQAASLCIRRAPRLRPKIGTVLKLVRGDDDVTKCTRSQVDASEDFEGLDDETTFATTDFQSHLNLALLDVEDDALSVSSIDHSVCNIMANSSLEAYLQGRWSRSSSFD